jgi:hypothetical protein
MGHGTLLCFSFVLLVIVNARQDSYSARGRGADIFPSEWALMTSNQLSTLAWPFPYCSGRAMGTNWIKQSYFRVHSSVVTMATGNNLTYPCQDHDVQSNTIP